MSQIKELTAESFTNKITQTPLAIVDFTAEWCPPCRMMDPVYQRLAEKYGEQILFFTVDGDSAPALTARYSVQALPTFAFFKEGEMVKRIVGAMPGGKFEAEIAAFVQETAVVGV